MAIAGDLWGEACLDYWRTGAAEQLRADSRPFAGGGVVAVDNLVVARKYIGPTVAT